MADKKYFHNFNGVRLYLACYVLLFHIEEIKYVLHYPSLYRQYKFFEPLATSSITMFFTMSGFLISYFLFSEKMKSAESKISLPRFYSSRVTRIWPLYFLCFIIYWIIAPNSFLHTTYHEIYFTKFFPTLNEVAIPKLAYGGLFVLLLPQLAGAIAYTFQGMVVYAGHFWSIGSEELFYLFWPLFVNKFKSYRKMFKYAFFAVYIWYVLLIVLLIINKLFIKSSFMMSILAGTLSFLYLTRLYCMLIGCAFAYMYITDHRYLHFFKKNSVVAISVITMVIMLAFGIDAPIVVHEIYSLQWAVIILYLTREDIRHKWLDSKWISYFGSITYGVYLYHVIIIILMIVLAQYLQIKSTLYFNLFVYFFSFALTFIVAHFSYTYFESKFLRFKLKK